MKLAPLLLTAALALVCGGCGPDQPWSRSCGCLPPPVLLGIDVVYQGGRACVLQADWDAEWAWILQLRDWQECVLTETQQQCVYNLDPQKSENQGP